MSSNVLEFSVDKENKTVHIVRTFNASNALVWKAWTTADLLDQWWAPRPFAARTKSMNFEVGGKRFYAMVSPDGHERWAMHQYTSISPITHFKMLNTFADQDGNPELPGSEWDLTFSEESGTTKVSIVIWNESLERMERMIAMGFKEGFAMGLQQLEEMLPGLA